MLNLTKVEPELISDVVMYLFFEMIWETEFLKLEDKDKIEYLKSYDPKQESKYIIYTYKFTYMNANSLYGYTVSKFLPTSRFIWIDCKNFDLNKYNKNSSKSCILEGDFEYPKEFCELHDDNLLAQHKIEIENEMLSTYKLMIVGFYKKPIDNVKKLVSNVFW